jgi:hypothetical protein
MSSPLQVARPLIVRVTAARVAVWIDESVAKHALIWISVLAIIFMGDLSIQAWQSPLWTDDFYTYYIAAQPTLTGTIHAILEGCDQAPPLYALLVRPLIHLIPNTQFGLRLPDVFGMGALVICGFLVARRRLPASYSLATVLAICVAVRPWTTWARPYTLVLACTEVALLCWLSVPNPRRRTLALVGLCLSLTVAIALHYYAVFLIAALACGELVRWRRSGRPDAWAAAVLVSSTLILLPHLFLIRAGAPFIPYFWSKTSWYHLLSDPWTFAFKTLPFFAVALILNALWSTLAGPIETRPSQLSLPSEDEGVACVSLALLPLLIFMVAMLTTHTFVDRYAVPSAVGLMLMVVTSCWWVGAGSRILGVSLMLTFLITSVGLYTGPALRHPHLREGEEAKAILASAPATSAPIVLSDPHIFLELWHYSPPKLRSRLVHPLSVALSRKYANVDSDELLLSALRHRSSLPVPDYDQFLQSNPTFLLCTKPEDWMQWDLMRVGFTLKPLKRGEIELYQVTRGQ